MVILSKISSYLELSKVKSQFHHKVNFDLIFSSPVQCRDLNLKLRWKFNHGFTNQSYLHCVILKAFYNVIVKRFDEARNFSFKMFKIRFLKNAQKQHETAEPNVEVLSLTWYKV